jgi:hypothetical protein
MNTLFTVPETNITAMYKKDTREETVLNIAGVLHHITDVEMKEIAISVIGKLEKMTDGDFNNREFIAEYGEEGEIHADGYSRR